VVWKTLGEDPPIVNVNGPRYGVVYGADRRVLGLNNIELITDRPLEVNLREIARSSATGPTARWSSRSWCPARTGVEGDPAAGRGDRRDGIELNFGCPHGMSERGMGSAVGQVPEYIEMVTRWCKQNTRMPVIVKLTPNITDIRYPARAAKRAARTRSASSTRSRRSPR
jgi:dihydropyrimidine dehydrogenase (NAD+) subunit PreA